MKIKKLLLLLLVFAVSFLFYQSTFIQKSGVIYMDSKLYSDFAAHIPLIRSFSHNWNWPPEYPFFAGAPIRYHYLFYLLVGLLERVGLNLPLATNLLSALGMTILVSMIFLFTKTLFKSKAAGLLAVYLFLFNGSLTFVDYFNQNGWNWQSVLAIPKLEAFTNFGPWNGNIISAFWNLNIYTNQRHLALSFGLVLLLFWPLLIKTIKPRLSQHVFNSWQLLGVAILPILHQAGALILGIMMFLWLLYYRSQLNTKTKVWYLTLLLILVGSILLNVKTATGELPLVLGFLATDKSFSGIAYYWWYNLGLYFFLIPLLLGWSRKRMGILPLIGIVIFLLANSFRFSADLINNHKLINFAQIIFVMMTAGWLVQLWRNKLIFRPAVAILVIVLSLSGWMDLFPIINDYSGEIKDWSKLPIGEWIEQHTPARAQFLTGSYMYHPASFAGRTLFLDYGYHAWSMGYVDAPKRQALPGLYSSSIEITDWCALARKFKISHVVLNDGESSVEDGRILVQTSMIASSIRPTFESDGWRLWAVNEICP